MREKGEIWNLTKKRKEGKLFYKRKRKGKRKGIEKEKKREEGEKGKP